MGLLRVAADVLGAGVQGLSGAFQSGVWKEYFTSGAFAPGVLMKRGEKVTPQGSRNVRADDNLISSGSGIDVQEGECAIIVDNGAIVEFVAVAGRYTYDNSSQPSLLAGNNKGLKAFGKEILEQWSAGGQRFSTQRVYYIRLNELKDNPIKWGAGDIPFHHVQKYAAGIMELDMTVKGNGIMTCRIADPITFYKNYGAAKVAGGDNNGVVSLNETGFESTFKVAIVDKIANAIADISYSNQVSYTAIKMYSNQIVEYLNGQLNEQNNTIGLEVVTFSVNGGFIPSDDSKADLQRIQKNLNMTQNANLMNYDVQSTMAEGFKEAGKNGGISGVMGMGMAMGGMGAGMGNMQFQQTMPQQPVQPQPMQGPMQQQVQQPVQQPAPQPVQAAVATGAAVWTCECGTQNEGKFCKNCGAKKPEPVAADSWTCSCGTVNTGKFCMNCGTKKPEGHRHFRCDKCGFEGEIEPNLKFCPECGDIVNEADIVVD